MNIQLPVNGQLKNKQNSVLFKADSGMIKSERSQASVSLPRQNAKDSVLFSGNSNNKVKLQKNLMLQVAPELNQDRLVWTKTSAGSFEVTDKENAQLKVMVTQPENDPNQVEMYMGKGGFTAIVTTDKGTKYFLLPGTEFKLGNTEVSVTGSPIQPSSLKAGVSTAKTITPQTVTPQAMILGAGLATRFEPVSGENTGYSKPAVPLLGDESVIGLIANQLSKHGFDELFINTYFKPESLKDSLTSYNVAYVDENAPSGTAGGLRKMLENPAAFNFDPSKPLMVVQGDAVTDVNFSELMNAHVAKNAYVTIGCQAISDEDVSKFGIIETDQSDADGVSGKITSFVEKPQPHETTSRLGNTGFYIFSPESYPVILDVFKAMGPAGEKELDYAKHIFPKVLEKANQEGKTFWAQKVEGYWSDIGNPTQYLEAIHDIYDGKTTFDLPTNTSDYFDGGIVYWPGARQRSHDEGAHIKGNAVVALPVKKR